MVIADVPEVFRNSLFPEPPVRGLCGYATIELKPDAIPQRQKAFTLHGERGEAYKKSWRIGKTKILSSQSWGARNGAVRGSPSPKKALTSPGGGWWI